MRYARDDNKLLLSPALPKQHRVNTTDLTRHMGQLVRQAQSVLPRLRKKGVIGEAEAARLFADLVDAAHRINDLHKRELLAVTAHLREDLQHEIEAEALEHLAEGVEETRFVPDETIRMRLRSCSRHVLDFTDSMIEGLKRLRYSNVITETRYAEHRQMLESLPALRTETLHLMEKFQDD